MEQPYPLAVFAHCPRCGSRHGTAASVKRYNCPDCGFQYFQNAAAAVLAVISRPDGKVLFGRRSQEPARGKLDLLGGFVDPFETAEQALAREVMEEAGLRIGEARYLGTFTNRYDYAGVTYYTLDLAFLCPVTDLAGVAARDELDDVVWRDPHDVDPNELSFDSVRSVLRALLLLHSPAL